MLLRVSYFFLVSMKKLSTNPRKQNAPHVPCLSSRGQLCSMPWEEFPSAMSSPLSPAELAEVLILDALRSFKFFLGQG